MSSNDIFKTIAQCMGQEEKKDDKKFFGLKTQCRYFNTLEEARVFAQEPLFSSFIRIGYQLLCVAEIRACRIVNQNVLELLMSEDKDLIKWCPESVNRFLINPIYADDILHYIMCYKNKNISDKTWQKEWNDVQFIL